MFCALLGHTGERLQDHWSSDFHFTYLFLRALDGVKRKICAIRNTFTMFCIRVTS